MFFRIVVAADGPKSLLSRSVGLINSNTNVLWSRSFAKPGTHIFKADFAIFHPSEISPGFFVISKEVEDYLSLCCYNMSNSLNESELEDLHHKLITQNPQITKALGNDVEFTSINCAPMRIGGIWKCYFDQYLVVGSAAGHVDPLNGQGIQYAIIGGKLAARTILEGVSKGDLSSVILQKYQRRINNAFAYDLWMSGLLAKILYYLPSILDATAAMIKRNGEGPLKLWLSARSGSGSKFQFIRPDIIVMIYVEFIYQIIKCKIKSIC